MLSTAWDLLKWAKIEEYLSLVTVFLNICLFDWLCSHWSRVCYKGHDRIFQGSLIAIAFSHICKIELCHTRHTAVSHW